MPSRIFTRTRTDVPLYRSTRRHAAGTSRGTTLEEVLLQPHLYPQFTDEFRNCAPATIRTAFVPDKTRTMAIHLGPGRTRILGSAITTGDARIAAIRAIPWYLPFVFQGSAAWTQSRKSGGSP